MKQECFDCKYCAKNNCVHPYSAYCKHCELWTPKCNCYHKIYNKPECWGTKERDACSCNGDETKCDFYPEKRVVAQLGKKKEYEDIEDCLVIGVDFYSRTGNGVLTVGRHEDGKLYIINVLENDVALELYNKLIGK